ncbi:hypothetical protein BKA70DRAFT_1223050 [Coprinopsis sp. MPI-PUGE-AT-0042]|nr:hypothetical protein BKA70DRAFT_1223050 [Coprinopsis sp. MPI-PUGE-AT-0042]
MVNGKEQEKERKPMIVPPDTQLMTLAIQSQPSSEDGGLWAISGQGKEKENERKPRIVPTDTWLMVLGNSKLTILQGWYPWVTEVGEVPKKKGSGSSPSTEGSRAKDECKGKSVVIIGAYILPEYRDWSSWTDVDPWVKLVEVATHFSRNNDDGGEKVVLVIGDLNAWTKAKQGEAIRYARVSEDHRNALPRGNELVKMCGDNGLNILNGVPQFCMDGSSGNFTSHSSSSNGEAVVDYIMGNVVLLPKVASFRVLPLDNETSDHCALEVTITLNNYSPREATGASEAVKRPPRLKMMLPSTTLLDQTLIETVRSKALLHDRQNDLYGARFFEPEKTITVYTDGS